MESSVDLLLRFGFPPGVVAALREDGVESLLEPQVDALMRFDLLGREDLLVALPTSSGKTLIGELVGVGAALEGRRAVFSVPLKALAREKFESFQRRYAEYGLRIKLATGEFLSHTADIVRGDFDIAVVIHEKLKHLAVRHPGFLAGLGVVVFDELQGIEDLSRGPDLEFLLALLKTREPRVRRVGLVGTLAPDDSLIADFDGRVVTARRRPVDLRVGIVAGSPGLARTLLERTGAGWLEVAEDRMLSVYRSHNSGMIENETLPAGLPWGDEQDSELVRLACGLAGSGESALVFVATRRETESLAYEIANRLDSLADAECVLFESEDLDDDVLAFCLSHGVAYHHADCSPRVRNLVEEAFRAGVLKIVCSTSTLAMGVNLPARNVLIHPYVWTAAGSAGDLSLLPENIVRNMAGRAGRLGFGDEHGRALLVANTEREWDLYRRMYWTDLPPRLAAHFSEADWGPYVLAAVALGNTTEEAIRRVFENAISALLQGPRVDGGERPSVADCLKRAVDQGLLDVHSDTSGYHCDTTPLGRVAALRGLSLDTAASLAAWVERYGGSTPEPLATLQVVCSSVESQSWTWPRERHPDVRAEWVARVREGLGWDALRSLGADWIDGRAVTPAEEDGAKMAWTLKEWADGEPISRLRESSAGVSLGNLHAVGEGARWLVDSLGDIWKVHGKSADGLEMLRLLARRVGSGLPEWALGWEQVPSDLVDREQKLQLASEIPDPRDVPTVRAEDLSHLLTPQRFARLRKFMERVTAREEVRSTRAKSNGHGSARPACLLNANFSEQGAYFVAATWSQQAPLGMRSAELLLRLVRERKKGSSEGWIAKSELGVDPECLSQRISDLRNRLGPPPDGVDSWIESDRRGHYRLTVPPNCVRWDPESTPPPLRSLMR